MRELTRRLETFADAVAPFDVPRLYVVLDSNLSDVGGYVTPRGHELYRDAIGERYDGFAPTIAINRSYIQSQAVERGQSLWEAALPLFIHELAHVLDQPDLYATPPADPPTQPVAELRRALQEQFAAPRDYSAANPPTLGHASQWHRLTIHLVHRAQHAGEDVKAADAILDCSYVAAETKELVDALGSEPHEMRDMTFAEIAAARPPPEFTRLWTERMLLYLNFLRQRKNEPC